MKIDLSLFTIKELEQEQNRRKKEKLKKTTDKDIAEELKARRNG